VRRSTTKPLNKELVTSYCHNELKYDITLDKHTTSTCDDMIREKVDVMCTKSKELEEEVD
jgi:hypothetical protein